MAIKPLSRQETVFLTGEPLPPCWLRRSPSEPDRHETPSAGLFRVGPTGAFRGALIAGIEQAREVVLLSSFLLADEDLARAMQRAAERNVRVYVLTASNLKLATLPREDDDFEARMIEEHKQLLDGLAGKALLRVAEHFHAKFLITDPQSPAVARAWLSTANFNRALTESVELGAALDATAARTLAGWFSWAFWNEAEGELVAKGRIAAIGGPPKSPAAPGESAILVTTKSHNTLAAGVRRLIADARREIVVASYGLDVEHPSVQALIDKARAGVRVTVLTRPRPAIAAAAAALAAAGARVLAHDKLHAKAIVSDAGGLIMTANLESHGLDQGFEAGVRLGPQAAAALHRTLTEWAAWFPWTYAGDAKRGQHLGEICIADRGPRDGRRTIIPEQEVELPPIEADDALALDAVPNPELKAPAAGERIPQVVRFNWQVVPPRLPEKAKEQERAVRREVADKDGKMRAVESKEPYDLPVYAKGKQLFVLLQDARKASVARRLAGELGARVVVP